MKSIFTKIVLWAIGTIAVSLVGFVLTNRVVDEFSPGRVDLIARTHVLQLEDARSAYESGGPGGLARYLRRLDDLFHAEHFLVDAAGKDLVDGHDRSEFLTRAAVPPRPPFPYAGRLILASPPAAGSPRLLILIRPIYGPFRLLSHYVWIFLLILALGYALAVYLARPLRRLRQAVERFGQGDLATRIGSTRRDEIGELARAFDLMAQQIETLMTAERRLLQDVSHELRSPLARLGLAVQLARTSADREAALDRVKKEVDRLARLVDELLELTSAEGDARSRQREEVWLHDLLETLVDDCALEAEAKSCRLELDFGVDGPLAVIGDPELLRRAAENVVRNAIRHAPEGTAIAIDLRARGDTAAIVVRDFGGGVPEAALAAIFEPFFRVEGDRSRASGGVGLGLSIARRAVALHGGTIVADNAGPGLRITIVLPRDVEVAPVVNASCPGDGDRDRDRSR